MEIFIAIISIWVLGIAVFIFNFLSKRKICPICVGVAGTWLWMLFGIFSGWLDADSWMPIAAIAMGGSVVGIAYQLEKRLTTNSSRVFFKLFFIPGGFLVAYGVVGRHIGIFLLGALAVVVVIGLFGFLSNISWKTVENKSKVDVLEEKMKNCC